jgi:hypothetical protein
VINHGSEIRNEMKEGGCKGVGEEFENQYEGEEVLDRGRCEGWEEGEVEFL